MNTSFNVHGEPIVATAEDAYRCFVTTEIEWLLIDERLLDKREQPDYLGDSAVTVAD